MALSPRQNDFGAGRRAGRACGARIALLLAWFLAAPVAGNAASDRPDDPAPGPVLRDGETVAWVGGAALVSMEQDGRVETLLTLAHMGQRLRFRNLAWEGDTVFARPREINYPGLTQQLSQAGATLVLAQWGAAESMAGERGLPAFRRALEGFVREIRDAGPRVVLVTPPPFESKPPPLPDLGNANAALAGYAAAVRGVAAATGCAVVDLFEAFSHRDAGGELTQDGREWTDFGHQKLAAAWARALGRADWAEASERGGFWARSDVERVLEAVRRKNRLWFDASRPMNWAFLNGDRTEQRFSRDPADPSVRRFMIEMEQYGPLLRDAEARIPSAVAQGDWGGLR